MATGGQLLEHGRVGGRPRPGALDDRQPQPLEEDLPELGRRVDVEFGPCHPVNVLADEAEFVAQARAHRREEPRVDADAMHLHFGQNGDQRHLQLPEELLEPL